MCGCGEQTTVATRTDTGKGWLKGHPIKFADGHSLRVNHGPPPPLKPDSVVSATALHSWLRRHFPPAGRCDECGREARTDYASLTGHEYVRPRDLAELKRHFAELCRACHMRMDGHPRHRVGADAWNKRR